MTRRQIVLSRIVCVILFPSACWAAVIFLVTS